MAINSNVVKAIAGGITIFGAGVASTKLGELAIGKIKEMKAAKAEPVEETKPKKK